MSLLESSSIGGMFNTRDIRAMLEGVGTSKLLETIGISHREKFITHKASGNSSDLTFTNFFIWRHYRQFSFIEFQNHLIVQATSHDGSVMYYCPLGENPAVAIDEYLKVNSHAVFHRVPFFVANALLHHVVEHDRDNDDYIYLKDDLSSLAGSKYSAKRNFVKQFKELNPIVVPIHSSIFEKLIIFSEHWAGSKSSSGTDAELVAIREAFLHFAALNLFGIAVFVGDEIVGYAIGEQIGQDMVVEHIEKARSDLTGSYQFLLSAFAQSLPNSIKYINREQDMGIPGIKKSKESYHPSSMIQKYIVKK